MTKITVHADCGDALEKQLLRDLNIAYAHTDIEGVLGQLAENIHWQIVGEFEMRGKKQVRKVLGMMENVDTSELVINSIIVQGDEGAISGVITSEAGKSYAFCDVCRFSDAADKRIESIKSYTIEIKAGG